MPYTLSHRTLWPYTRGDLTEGPPRLRESPGVGIVGRVTVAQQQSQPAPNIIMSQDNAVSAEKRSNPRLPFAGQIHRVNFVMSARLPCHPLNRPFKCTVSKSYARFAAITVPSNLPIKSSALYNELPFERLRVVELPSSKSS